MVLKIHNSQPPTKDASRHQDYCIFSRRSLSTITFPLESWVEGRSKMYICISLIEKLEMSWLFVCWLEAILFTPWSIWFWWPKSIQCTYCWWLASWCSSYPVIYSVLYIQGGVGFLPTVGGYTTQLWEKLIALQAQSRRCIVQMVFLFF